MTAPAGRRVSHACLRDQCRNCPGDIPGPVVEQCSHGCHAPGAQVWTGAGLRPGNPQAPVGPPFGPDDVLGYIDADHQLADDAAGGKFLEPQRRVPIHFRDLHPFVQLAMNAAPPKAP